MNSEEKQAWEEDKGRRLEETSERMLRIPQVVAALDSRTVLTLTCPRDHKLFPVRLDLVGTDEKLTVVPLNDYGREGRSVTTNGSPFGTKRVCLQPDCPVLVEYEGRCQAHGNREAVHLEGLATRFTCRVQKCGYSERVATDRLLKVVTAALIAGVTRVPVSGHVARRDRRQR